MIGKRKQDTKSVLMKSSPDPPNPDALIVHKRLELFDAVHFALGSLSLVYPRSSSSSSFAWGLGWIVVWKGGSAEKPCAGRQVPKTGNDRAVVESELF